MKISLGMLGWITPLSQTEGTTLFMFPAIYLGENTDMMVA
jgi:hypothetical protein